MILSTGDEQPIGPGSGQDGGDVGAVGHKGQPLALRKLAREMQNGRPSIQKHRVAIGGQIGRSLADPRLFGSIPAHPFGVCQLLRDLRGGHRAAVSAPDQAARLEIDQIAAHRRLGHAQIGRQVLRQRIGAALKPLEQPRLTTRCLRGRPVRRDRPFMLCAG